VGRARFPSWPARRRVSGRRVHRSWSHRRSIPPILEVQVTATGAVSIEHTVSGV
jgi:hypothetical protein